MNEFTAPVQIVVDHEALLDQIGWRDVAYENDGEPYEVGGPVDLRTGLASQVAHVLASQLRSEMTSVVRDVIQQVAAEQVSSIVAEVISGDVRKTNQWGEASGEPVSLRSLVVDQVKEQLDRRVDHRGEKSMYGREAMPYVQYVALTAAKEALRGELAEATKQAVAEVKAKVQSVVADQLGAEIAKAVTR